VLFHKGIEELDTCNSPLFVQVLTHLNLVWSKEFRDLPPDNVLEVFLVSVEFSYYKEEVLQQERGEFEGVLLGIHYVFVEYFEVRVDELQLL